MDVPPLTNLEQNALKWVSLCTRFGLNPLEATSLDFVPKEDV